MNPLFTLFYNLSSELDKHFRIQWVKVHQLSTNLLSGFGFYRRQDVNMYIHDFLNLRVSLNPKSYEIDCSNESLYAQICQLIEKIDYKGYQLYVDMFKDLIPAEELNYKR